MDAPPAAHHALAVVRAIEQPKCRHLETFPALPRMWRDLAFDWAPSALASRTNKMPLNNLCPSTSNNKETIKAYLLSFRAAVARNLLSSFACIRVNSRLNVLLFLPLCPLWLKCSRRL